MFRLDMDGGYSEMFQYAQFILIGLLLILAGFRTKIGVYYVWAIFFLFLFLVDSFSFHEIFGKKIVNFFQVGDFAGFESQALGELIVAAGSGVVFILPFLFTLWKGNSQARQVTQHLILLTGILMCFGVGMDAVHSLLNDHSGSGFITVVEDAGEMFAASLLVWYSMYLVLDRNGYALFKSEYFA